MGLREYQRKRDFAATREPAEGGERGRGIFVVQLHHASHRHYDFRLEFDGVLKSWAIPKGPSLDPSIKRLAVEVEDHPLSYAAFEGDIPAGNYGAGHVDVFDRGLWEPLGNAQDGLRNGELKFTLHGDVLRGSWVLVRTRKQGDRQQWLLIKHHDEYAGAREADSFVDRDTGRPIPLARRRKVWVHDHDAAILNDARKMSSTRQGEVVGSKREALPEGAFAPELCKPEPAPPAGDGWLHEVKWDGYRIVATVVRGKARLWSRNAIEWTGKLPELVQAIQQLGLTSAQLDGEMIVLRNGRDDFNALQVRLRKDNAEPAVYMLFDLPYRNGQSLRDVPLLQRKALLAQLLRQHPHPLLRYSEHQRGNGAEVFAQAQAAGLEGVISKRIDSPYRGMRNGNWIKTKRRPSDEFVVIGYTEPKGSRSGIGALLLAQPDAAGHLSYVGRVGSGFADELLDVLRARLDKTLIAEPTADIGLMTPRDRKLAIWVKPRIVAEVFHHGLGGQGLLRQASFKTLRADKKPADLHIQKVAEASTVARRGAPNALAIGAGKSATSIQVPITHPDREVFPGSGISKGDVAAYYRAISEWLLPEIAGRPLSVVRCPAGVGKPCFFQKHESAGWGKHVHGIAIKDTKGQKNYLWISDVPGLMELVQMNVLEFHPWGATTANVEHADRIVFDLDPHVSVAWSRVRAAARELRARLESIGLQSFVRTSGGKGLHVVVPLNPPAAWNATKRFAQAVAEALATLHPKEFVSVAGEKNRKGKIFVDWLRNSRGATSVASYSLRARAGAGVAMPLDWDELGKIRSGEAFTIRNALKRVRANRTDPWETISTLEQPLPKL